MDIDTLAKLPIWFGVFVFSTTCHEAAHALVAHLGGDSTAYEGGQVSLDPVPHMRREPFGMVIVPLVSFLIMGGWMIGWASAPYDPRWAMRYPKRAALMSAAGPAANFLLAAIAFVLIVVFVRADVLQFSNGGIDELVVATSGVRTSGAGALGVGLSVLLTLNVILGLFNLFPIPPLDGGGILEGLFPDGIGEKLREFRSSQYGFFGLMIVWYIFPKIAGPALGLVFRFLVLLS